MLKLSEIDFH